MINLPIPLTLSGFFILVSCRHVTAKTEQEEVPRATLVVRGLPDNVYPYDVAMLQMAPLAGEWISELKKAHQFSPLLTSYEALESVYRAAGRAGIAAGYRKAKNDLSPRLGGDTLYKEHILEQQLRFLLEEQNLQQQSDQAPILRSVLNRYNFLFASRDFSMVLASLPSTGLPEAVTEQLFQNVISNTLRHGTSEAARPRLKICLSHTGPAGRPCWVVEDLGPGIPPDRLGVIFRSATENVIRRRQSRRRITAAARSIMVRRSGQPGRKRARRRRQDHRAPPRPECSGNAKLFTVNNTPEYNSHVDNTLDPHRFL